MPQRPDYLYPLEGSEFEISESGHAANYCIYLLKSLGGSVTESVSVTVQNFAIDAATDWAQSGLMYLTGQDNGPPLQGPGCIPSCATGALNALRLLANRYLLPGIDGSTLLSERAAMLGLARRGMVSPNGSCRLLQAKDTWIALNLARDDDWDLLPAWLEITHQKDNQSSKDYWAEIAKKINHLDAQLLVTRGRLMGLPIANTNSRAQPNSWYILQHPGYTCTKKRQDKTRPLVVDLSSLWAGPLCGYLLEQAGARVIKVESADRPDGARRGSKDFYNILNAGKQCIALDFSSDYGRHQLKTLLGKADIVIEGSRPRALSQLGIDAETIVKSTPGLTWIGISGYGRDELQSNWVAFGDDAAAAAGVVAATSNPPLFCGDALADPLTGLHAAVAALAFWSSGSGGLLDISLCDTTAHCLNFVQDIPRGEVLGKQDDWRLLIEDREILVRPPIGRKPSGAAPVMGFHTQQILREFQISC